MPETASKLVYGPTLVATTPTTCREDIAEAFSLLEQRQRRVSHLMVTQELHQHLRVRGIAWPATTKRGEVGLFLWGAKVIRVEVPNQSVGDMRYGFAVFSES